MTLFECFDDTSSLVRRGISELKLRESDGFSLTFDAGCLIQLPRKISSGDPEMGNFATRAKTGEKISGTLRIDRLENDVFRIRYAEAGGVPENNTPMLLKTPARAETPAEPVINGQLLSWQNGSCRLEIDLNSGKMTLFKNGGKVCSAGGRERNFFCRGDEINTGLCYDTKCGHTYAAEFFSATVEDGIFGFGEQFGKLNKAGQRVTLDISDAMGVATPRIYKGIPFFWNTAGYGVFFNQSCRMRFEVCNRSAMAVQALLDDDFLDYFLFAGKPEEIIDRYTALTGRAAMVPEWSFELWHSKCTYRSAAEMSEVVEKLKADNFPCRIIHADVGYFSEEWRCDLNFDPVRFPELEKWLGELKKSGTLVTVWQLPYIPEGSEYFNDLASCDGFVKNAAGELYDCKLCLTPGFSGKVGVIDFTNPAAVKVVKKHLGRLFDLGVAAIKTDFGEEAPVDGIYFDGTPGHRMHNLYPLLYNRVVSEITREKTGNGMVWARSAWAGSQRYPLHWGGDSSPDFNNMRPQLCGGLSLGACGFTFWSQDIGGFLGDTTEELMIRSFEFGMFNSHCRVHGIDERELYRFPDSVKQIFHKMLKLRESLRDYILSEAEYCCKRGWPMMRLLPMAYPDDRNTFNISDEYLFGRNILIAPVMEEGAVSRQVYFPAGSWINGNNGKVYSGNTWAEVEAPLDEIPFFRRGTAAPEK